MSSSVWKAIILLFVVFTAFQTASASSLPSLSLRDDDDDKPDLKGNPSLRTNVHIAHGVIISTSVILIFPLGTISLRFLQHQNMHSHSSPSPSANTTAIHAHILIQLFGTFILILGFAIGAWLSYLHHELWNQMHERFGTVLFVLFVLQPILGYTNHLRYEKLSQTTNSDFSTNEKWVKFHIWYGRLLILLGTICGGTGVQLAANWTNEQMSVYVVFAVVVFCAYAGVLGRWARCKVVEKRRGSESVGASGSRESGVFEDRYGGQKGLSFMKMEIVGKK